MRSRGCLALVLTLLFTACQPLHPSREVVPQRMPALLEMTGSDPVLEAHVESIPATLATIGEVQELQDALDDLLVLLDQVLGQEAGPVADAAIADVLALAQTVLEDPRAAPYLEDTLAAMHAARADPAHVAAIDALLRFATDLIHLPEQRHLPTVGLFGDASAFGLLWHSAPYVSSTNPGRLLRLGPSKVSLSCGLLPTALTCPSAQDWGDAATAGTEMAFVHTGRSETACLQLEGWAQCRTLGDPIFDDAVRAELDARSTALLNAGVRTVVYAKTVPGTGSDGSLVVQHPQRWQRLHELLDEHAASDHRIRTVDMATWWSTRADDAEIRPGGWVPGSLATRVWADFLAPSLYEELWLPRWGFLPPEEPHNVPLLSALWEQSATWEPQPLPRVGIYGDSTALGLRTYSGEYTSANENRKLEAAGGVTPLGCGITMSHSWCKTAQEWADVAATNATDIAVIYTGTWETRCILPSTEPWDACRNMGDPIFEDYLRRELDERSAALLGPGGAQYVVHVRTNVGVESDPATFVTYPDRWERFHELLDEYAATDDRILVVDMIPWWLDDPVRDSQLRPDGRHFNEGAWIVWRDYLEDTLYWGLWLDHLAAA